MINRRKVELLIPYACKVLNSSGIKIVDQKTGMCNPQYRSAISSFGAAVTMGSLNAAVCYLFNDKSEKINRRELLRALYMVAQYQIPDNPKRIDEEQIADVPTAQEAAGGITRDNAQDKKQKYLTAAVALKLALNLFIEPAQNDGNAAENAQAEEATHE